jgi:vitamin B12 transporter
MRTLTRGANEGTSVMGYKGHMVAAALVLTPASALAQINTNIGALPEITVSATRIPTPLQEIANSVTVITAEEIERAQRRTVPDLLMTQPGLNVVQTGGPGGQTAVFIRGTNANHVKVLLDGIDISDPTVPNGAVDLGHVLTSNIDRVEILRGPQSGLYGANAIGGVIYLTTRKGEGPAKATGTLEAGSYGTFNQSADLSGAQGRFNYTFNVTHFRSASTPVTPDYVLPPGQRRNNDSYDNKTISSRVGVDFSDEFSVNVYGRVVDSRLFFTNDSFDFTTFLFVPNPTQTDQHALQGYGRAEAVWAAFDGRFINTFGVNRTYSTRTSEDPAPALPQTFSGWRDKYDWRGDIKVAPGQTVLLGLEHEVDSVSVPLVSKSRDNNAAFAELQLEWAKRIFLVSNIRYDNNEVFGGHQTYRLAPAFIVPGTETKLKATYGTGFKAPTLLELYGDDPVNLFRANRNLQPEESKGWDTGFEQPLFNGRASFGATYYRNDIKNLIQFVQVAPALFSNANIGQAEIHGYEAFVAANITDQIKVRGDYTQTNAKDAVTNAELVRRPRHKWSATATWQPAKEWNVSANVVMVSKWVDFDRPSSLFVTAPGYTVVNLAANYRVNNNAEAFARIDNLLNENYENPYGWLRPGRAFYAGFRVNI